MSFSNFDLSGDLSLSNIIDIIRFNKNFKLNHPNYFQPDGIIIFTGPQGSGKTLSAVRYVSNLKKHYPKCMIVSNIHLNFIDYKPFIGFKESIEQYNNGELGMILLIDEIQTEFSSLESKNISPSTLAAISQQRKRRIHIVGTSQLWTRIAKPFREQTSGAVDCDSILGGKIQRNRVIDFNRCAYDMNGNLTELRYKKQYLWTRTIKDYQSYDTNTVIERIGKTL